MRPIFQVWWVMPSGLKAKRNKYCRVKETRSSLLICLKKNIIFLVQNTYFNRIRTLGEIQKWRDSNLEWSNIEKVYFLEMIPQNCLHILTGGSTLIIVDYVTEHPLPFPSKNTVPISHNCLTLVRPNPHAPPREAHRSKQYSLIPNKPYIFVSTHPVKLGDHKGLW